ncbi:MAG: Gfo/Idh/MocA family oxidoreductase [Acidobacteriota bacterium]
MTPSSTPNNFALVGAAGFVAPRHLRAIHDTGHRLVAAVDPHDSVGVLDSFFPQAAFFTEIERFDRHLEKLRRRGEQERVHWVSVCSPNFLHDAHVRLALRVKAHAICEKPLVISPWNLRALEELEEEYQRRVYTILQLRLAPSVQELRARLMESAGRSRPEVELTYITRRGAWYHRSWKGTEVRSGGLAMNIGIHFFDLLLWLFGAVEKAEVHVADDSRMAGLLELEGARVRWALSVDGDDLPPEAVAEGRHAHRVLAIDGEGVELSQGFTDLHTRAYEEILSGRGFGIADARPSIELVHQLRTLDPVSARGEGHRLLRG